MNSRWKRIVARFLQHWRRLRSKQQQAKSTPTQQSQRTQLIQLTERPLAVASRLPALSFLSFLNFSSCRPRQLSGTVFTWTTKHIVTTCSQTAEVEIPMFNKIRAVDNLPARCRSLDWALQAWSGLYMEVKAEKSVSKSWDGLLPNPTWTTFSKMHFKKLN